MNEWMNEWVISTGCSVIPWMTEKHWSLCNGETYHILRLLDQFCQGRMAITWGEEGALERASQSGVPHIPFLPCPIPPNSEILSFYTLWTQRDSWVLTLSYNLSADSPEICSQCLRGSGACSGWTCQTRQTQEEVKVKSKHISRQS